MSKLKFLLIDANVVIQLWELGIWDEFIKRCDVILSEIVALQEVQFCVRNDEQVQIDLQPYIDRGEVTCVGMTASQMQAFTTKFSDEYIGKLDPGEAESLCYLDQCSDPCLICSSDGIVYRVLGTFNLGEQGLSLEEILGRIGMTQPLASQYTKQFRERFTKQGSVERIQDRSLRR